MLASFSSGDFCVAAHFKGNSPTEVLLNIKSGYVPCPFSLNATIEPIEPWGVSLGNELIHFRFFKSLLPVGERHIFVKASSFKRQ